MKDEHGAFFLRKQYLGKVNKGKLKIILERSNI